MGLRTLVIIPTYNEAENIAPLTQAALENVTPNTEILIVDDGSPDGTGKIAAELSSKNPRIHVLHRSGKQGLGTAYVAGFRWGLERDFAAFIEMDADFSHDPHYLKDMQNYLEQYDVVIGSRYVSGGGTKNWGFSRKVISRGGSLYSRVILGANLRDFTGGFNGWRKEVLESIQLDTLRSDGYSFQIELKYRAYKKGFRIHEFPIVFEDRKVGHSKMSRRIVFEALVKVWQFRSCS